MLNRDTTLSWTRDLVAFINRDVTGMALAQQPAHFPRLPFQRRRAAHYEGLRARAEETVRWIISLPEVTTAHRRGIEEWLADRDVVTTPDYSLVAMDAGISFDDEGRLVLTTPWLRSLDARVALTIANLATPDCAAEIRTCALDTCSRLFVRERRTPGRPQLCCCDAHANTLRTHRKRQKDRKRSRR
jgi:hypothetical protein